MSQARAGHLLRGSPGGLPDQQRDAAGGHDRRGPVAQLQHQSELRLGHKITKTITPDPPPPPSSSPSSSFCHHLRSYSCPVSLLFSLVSTTRFALPTPLCQSRGADWRVERLALEHFVNVKCNFWLPPSCSFLSFYWPLHEPPPPLLPLP